MCAAAVRRGHALRARALVADLAVAEVGARSMLPERVLALADRPR
jgi:hypothetical protein